MPTKKAKRAISLAPEDQVLDPSFIWEPPPEKGDGLPVSGRVSGVVKGLVQQIVQTGLFRFRTEGDLVRTAVAWFIRERLEPYLADGRVTKAVREVEEVVRAQKHAAARAMKIDQFYRDLRKTVVVLLTHNDGAGARQHILDVEERLAEMEDRPWANAVLRLIREDPGLQKAKEAGQ